MEIYNTSSNIIYCQISKKIKILKPLEKKRISPSAKNFEFWQYEDQKYKIDLLPIKIHNIQTIIITNNVRIRPLNSLTIVYTDSYQKLTILHISNLGYDLYDMENIDITKYTIEDEFPDVRQFNAKLENTAEPNYIIFWVIFIFLCLILISVAYISFK